MKNSFVLILIIGTWIVTGCATLQYPPPPTPEVQSLPPAAFGTLATHTSASARNTILGDLDVLMIGPDVQEISSAYDEYWNSDLSYPGTAMSDEASFEELQSRRKDLNKYLNQKGSAGNWPSNSIF